MDLLRLTAASMLLVGFSAADADTRRNPRQMAERNISTDQPLAETKLEAGWAQDLRDDSYLWQQASTVFAALASDEQSSEPSEAMVERVEVAGIDTQAEVSRDGNGSEGCIFMAIPGSRIHDWRCYYPSEGEKELNDYQFKAEIRQMAQTVEQLELQRQQAEAMLNAYSSMFQRR